MSLTYRYRICYRIAGCTSHMTSTLSRHRTHVAATIRLGEMLERERELIKQPAMPLCDWWIEHQTTEGLWVNASREAVRDVVSCMRTVALALLAVLLMAFAGCDCRQTGYRVQWISQRTALMDVPNFARYRNEINGALARPASFDQPILSNAGTNGAMFTAAFSAFDQANRDANAHPIEDAGSIYFPGSDYLILRVQHLGRQTGAERLTLIASQARRDDRKMGEGHSILWSILALQPGGVRYLSPAAYSYLLSIAHARNLK